MPASQEDGARTNIPQAQIACIIFAQALTELMFALYAPFFPGECANRGIGHAVVGTIFSTPMLIALIAAPAVPSLCRWLGNRSVVFVSLMGMGVISLLWVAVDRIEGRAWFVTFSLVLRACEGAFAGVFEGASTSLLLKLADEDMIGAVMSWSESGRAIGTMIGPSVGGLLYDHGGFQMPFLFTAGLVFVLVGPLAFLMRRAALASDGTAATAAAGEEATSDVSKFIALLRLPMVTTGLACNFIIFATVTAFDPTMQPFLAQPPLLLSASSVGLIFGLTVLTFIIFSAMSDPIARCASTLIVLIGGLCIAAGSLLLVGPSPLLYRAIPMLPQQSLPLICCSLIGFGLGVGLTMAPSASFMVRAAISEGLNMEIASDQLATLTTLSFTLAGFVGPISAGFIVQWLGGPKLGFQLLTTILSLLMATLAAAIFCLFSASGSSRQALLRPDSNGTPAAANIAEVTISFGSNPDSTVTDPLLISYAGHNVAEGHAA